MLLAGLCKAFERGFFCSSCSPKLDTSVIVKVDIFGKGAHVAALKFSLVPVYACTVSIFTGVPVNKSGRETGESFVSSLQAFQKDGAALRNQSALFPLICVVKPLFKCLPSSCF